MAIWISDSNAVSGTAKAQIRDCCKRKINRIYLKDEKSLGTWIVSCKICGATHYGLEADPLNLSMRR